MTVELLVLAVLIAVGSLVAMERDMAQTRGLIVRATRRWPRWQR